MNTETQLPPLSEASIERIERAVLDEIGEARPAPAQVADTAPRAKRRRRWVTGIGIAAAFVGGILIAPPLLNAVSPTGAGSIAQYDTAVSGDAPIGLQGASEAATSDGVASDSAGGADAAMPATEEGRDIISTAEATVRVEDVPNAVDAIAALAADHDGYVEATDVGFAPDAAMITPDAPQQPGTGWISIRVPAGDLTAVISALDAQGDVVRSSISRQDVTSAVVDLEARVDAARASVKRLTELMSKSGSVGDLIAAESALSERQAQLESYEQQLKGLGEQVAMSTLSIHLTEQATATKADPAGFGDGLLAGWNGLIVSLNAVVVAVGFLLPWLAIAGVAVLVVWLVRRGRRHRTASNPPAESA